MVSKCLSDISSATDRNGHPHPDPAARAMSRILLKLAERSLPSMLLRDFQLFVKNSVMQLV